MSIMQKNDVKEVRDGKLGRYTLDIVGVDTDGDN